ncbi:MAG: hypothetical protein M3T56_01940 [Chloroflexota bacterium]|nr:hypothetical protein [Chloroflexota bacterium]
METEGALAVSQTTRPRASSRAERAVGRLAWSLTVGYGLIAITAIVLRLRNGGGIDDVSVAVLPGFGVYAVVGGLLAARRPRNPIGWLMLATALATGTNVLADEFSVYGLLTVPGSMPVASFAGWLALWLHPSLATSVLMVFLFPTGRLPSRRWQPVLWVSLTVIIGTALIDAFGAPGSGQHPEIVNPYLISALRPVSEALGGASWISFSLLGLGVASLVARYRRASRTERQQLKWIVMAAVLLFVSIVFASILGGLAPAPIRVAIALALLPVAIGIAILRHRLLDIDLLIKRTVVYGATTTAIAAVFFFGIVALQTMLRPVTGGSELAIAASTLVSFALFQPVRRWLHELVDRRFDRSRYDAARTLEAFADQLRDEVDLDTLRDDLLGAVRQTMAPAHASFWLRRRP